MRFCIALAGNGSGKVTNGVSYWQRMYALPGSTPYIQITNRYIHEPEPSTGTWFATNSVFLAFMNCGTYFPGATNGEGAAQSHIYWQSPSNHSWFDMFFNPYHDGYTQPGQAEMQISTSGGMAISTGYGYGPSSKNYASSRRALQLGIGGYGQPYMYHQYNNLMHAWETNATDTMYPIFYKALIYTNAEGAPPGAVWAGSLTPVSSTIHPAQTFRGYNRPDGTRDGSGAWTWYDNLDYEVQDNGQWKNMATATKRFEIVAGPSGGVNINGAVTINGAVGITTNYPLYDGNVMCISNGLITGIIPSRPNWDPVVTNYLARVGIETNSSLATAINAFASALKMNNVWTNVLDAVYPFCGGNATSNAVNLLSTNYTITWSGVFYSNNVYGVNNFNTNCYGNTGWRPSSQNNGTLFAFVKADYWDDSYHAVMGSYAPGFAQTGLRHTSNNNNWIYNYNSPSAVFGVIGSGSVPTSFCIVRYNTNAISFYQGGSPVTVGASQDTAAPCAQNLYLFANNNAGSGSMYWAGTLHGVVLSTNSISSLQYKAIHDAFVTLNAAIGR